MKVAKKLFTGLVTAGAIAAAVGYYHGLRPNNYKQFFAELASRYTSNEHASEEIHDSTTVVVRNSSSSTTKKASTATVKQNVEFQALPVNPFEAIDQHARACPPSEAQNIDQLALYLNQNTNTDLEKARAIYIWLTKNIRYDDVSYNTDKDADNSAEGVLKSRKAVCEGFSNLYQALGKKMNLQILKVIGYSKGYSYNPGSAFKDSNHAWNVIKIDGQWRVFDATWGEGNGITVNGKLRSKKEFDNYWFNVNPYEAIFSHLPENKNMQFVQPSMDLKTYEIFPKIESGYFQLGFDGAFSYRKLFENKTLQLPDCYSLPTYVKATNAPKFSPLVINKTYSFEFYIPRGISVAVIDSKNTWTYFDLEKSVFKLEYKPEVQGPISISIKYEKGGKSFSTILKYQVIASKLSV